MDCPRGGSLDGDDGDGGDDSDNGYGVNNLAQYLDDDAANAAGEPNFNNSNDGKNNKKEKANKSCSCQHYRNLSSYRVATSTCREFRPTRPKDMPQLEGGELSKFGVADIEDLCSFGRQIDLKRNVAIYRKPMNEVPGGEPKFGMNTGERAMHLRS